MKLSIVATLYQSAQYVEEFWRRSAAVARELVQDSYEIILVNDGSPDKSLDLAIGLSETDPHVLVVDLSRNFGHHKAMMAGLAHARGDLVFLIDSDLEEEPEWLISFAKQLSRDCCDVVYGVQSQRKGGIFERWSGRWYYMVFRSLSGLPLPENVVAARLMSQRYVKALLLHTEREIMIGGLCLITGFDQRAQTVEKHSRATTTYTLRKKISTLITAITSFSNAPLIAIFYIGAIILFMAGGYITYLLARWAFFSRPLSGWTSVMASIWLLGGLIISFVGVIGIYLSKIFSETKRRPNTIVRQIYGSYAEKEKNISDLAQGYD